ncbi:hypothetical protein vseg_010411 [Gypsophila vaccaria]
MNMGLGFDQGREPQPSVGRGEGGGVLSSGARGGNVGVITSNYVSIQTGEEFSSEFIRDRLITKVGHGPPGILNAQNREMGVGSSDEQMGHEDFARVLGLKRLNSECGSDVTEVSSAHGCAVEVDTSNRVDRRCHIDSGQGMGPGVVSGVPPIVIPRPQHSCSAYELGSSDSSQSGNVRILCSVGGRILPRPSDAKLRYVGGDTYIISIKRNISLEELVHKVSGKCNQPHTIKYQLPGEDLDALISVSSDEDLQNMIEECTGLERSVGSQRLRMFLIPTSETDQTSGTLQQAAAEYEYVVAVNGLVDLSPPKTSAEQVFTGIVEPVATLDHNPSFQVDSPSSFLHVESKDSVSFSQASHLGDESLNTVMSPSESPLCYAKPGVAQGHEDSLWQRNGESNSSMNATEQQFDELFGKPSLQVQESHFQAYQGGDCLVTPPLTDENQNNYDSQPPLLQGMSVHQERYMSQVDSRGFMLGSVDSTDSHHGMIHAYSDSQLHQYGEKPSYPSPDGMGPYYPVHFSTQGISSQTLSTPLQDEAVQLPENVHVLQSAVNNQLMDIEPSSPHYGVDMPMPLSSDQLHCNPYVENCHDLDKQNKANYSYHILKPQDSDPFGFQNMNMPHLQQGTTYQNVSPLNSVDLINPNALQYQDTASSSIDATSASKQEKTFSDQKQLVPLVVIEDMTCHTPQAAEFSSKVTSHVLDGITDRSEHPYRAKGVGSWTQIKPEDDNSTGVPKDDAIIDARMTRIESGPSGLQIIKSADIEELRELGSGTYGTVYHGNWRGSDVAVKRIKKSCFSGRSSEQERLTRDFWREAQILSRLHHPNVVAFYGVVPNESGETLATVTEFMVNGSLWNILLKKDGSLDSRRKLIIAMDAAFGMEYLHSKNIVHFDLKCDNLLVDMRDLQRPICKVGDFGLSRIKRNTLVSGGVRGTLPWMAPELLNGSSNKVSEKVDVFSFGIAMWEILTGEEPYANMHCGAIIGGILKNTLRPPIPERCDPDWRNLMEQCWSAEPDMRPSFTEVTNRLRLMSAAVQSR